MIASPFTPHSERNPEAMIRLKSMAKMRYSKLFPVLTAANPIAMEMKMNHFPSVVNRRKRFMMEI